MTLCYQSISIIKMVWIQSVEWYTVKIRTSLESAIPFCGCLHIIIPSRPYCSCQRLNPLATLSRTFQTSCVLKVQKTNIFGGFKPSQKYGMLIMFNQKTGAIKATSDLVTEEEHTCLAQTSVFWRRRLAVTSYFLQEQRGWVRPSKKTMKCSSEQCSSDNPQIVYPLVI